MGSDMLGDWIPAPVSQQWPPGATQDLRSREVTDVAKGYEGPEARP